MQSRDKQPQVLDCLRPVQGSLAGPYIIPGRCRADLRIAEPKGLAAEMHRCSRTQTPRRCAAQAAVPFLAHHYMPGAGGIVAMEGYHAGSVRMLLYQSADVVVEPWGITVAEVTAVLS